MATNWRARRERARNSAFLNSTPPPDWKRSVAEQFEEYWTRIYPDPRDRPNDESVPYIETRRAFYAGMFTMLCAMRAIAEPEVSEKDAFEFVEGCHKECIAFYERMRRIYEDMQERLGLGYLTKGQFWKIHRAVRAMFGYCSTRNTPLLFVDEDECIIYVATLPKADDLGTKLRRIDKEGNFCRGNLQWT